MKKPVLFILFLSTSLACLAVVRPPLAKRLFNSYYNRFYRLPKRNYGNATEQLGAIEENQKNIASKIANQDKVIENLKQNKAKLSDVTWFKTLRQKNVDRKLQKAELRRKKLKEAEDANFRYWGLTLEQLGAKKLEKANIESWKDRLKNIGKW